MEHPSYAYPTHLIPILEWGGLALLLVAATLASGVFHRLDRAVLRAASLLCRRLAPAPRQSWRIPLTLGLLAFVTLAVWTAVAGAPVPHVGDEVAYLINAETFASGRLTNPPAPHPALAPEHVIAEPAFLGKYPPAQSVVLAIGVALDNEALGAWLAALLLVATATWCLEGWLPRRWALLGGVLVLLRIGIGSYWNHSYWGGAVAAASGFLLWGGLRRWLRREQLGGLLITCAGALLLALSRPFEGFLATLPAAVVAAGQCRRLGVGSPVARRAIAVALGALVLLVGLLLAHNYAVTGSPWTLPHSHYAQSSELAGEFLWDRWSAEDGRSWTLDHELEGSSNRGWWWEALRRVVPRSVLATTRLLGSTVLLSLLFGLFGLFGLLLALLRHRRLDVPGTDLGIASQRSDLHRLDLALVLSTLLVLLGHALVDPYFSHYSAPIAAPLWILGTSALRRLTLAPPGWLRPSAGFLVIALVLESVSFLVQIPALRHDREDPSRLRYEIERQVEALAGRHVIVTTKNGGAFRNHGNLLDAKVLWARDDSGAALAALRELFPDRQFWNWDPFREPRLVPLPE